MNIKIAICDDEVVICSHLEQLLIDIFKNTPGDISYEIEPFSDGERLCRELDRTEYDLIFLDIELPGKNGIEVGKYIRDVLKNEQVQIAYVSSKEQYSMELFDFRPINFLIKPLNMEKVKKVIDKYLILTQNDIKKFSYKIGHSIYDENLSNIMYFAGEGRKIDIVTIDGKKEFYGKIDNVYEELAESNFLHIHKSIIVNYKYIKIITYDNLTDGVELPISQSKRKTVREEYLKIRKREKHGICNE